MIVWTNSFPKRKKPLGYIRLLLARYRYFDRIGLIKGKYFYPKIKIKPGYQSIIRSWRDKYKNKRCFVIGNGPSLSKMDTSFLRHEITIGSNAIYKAFKKWGFHTNYLIFEDTEQTELRGPDIPYIKGPMKLAAIYNAYAFKNSKDIVFMNVRRADSYYWDELAPMFSKDFADIIYLGSTVTYLGLQLAYHLGCNPVYLIGVDHDYGSLPDQFPPGKITITEQNIDLIKNLHFDKKYYKVGDQIGVPHVLYQEAAYAKAKEEFESDGRKIINAGINSKLEVYEKCELSSILGDKSSY